LIDLASAEDVKFALSQIATTEVTVTLSFP